MERHSRVKVGLNVQRIRGWSSEEILSLIFYVNSSSLLHEKSLDRNFADTKTGTALTTEHHTRKSDVTVGGVP
jgi:hypothetical protein